MSEFDRTAAAPGRRIVYHSLLNFVGTGSPLLVALVAIPLLIGGLGTERFGALALVWVLIGYLGLFDLGIGRALTKLVAERLGTREEEEIPVLVGTGLVLMCVLGLAGAVLVAAVTPWFARSVLNLPAQLEAETVRAFLLLALGLPVVTATTALRGVLEAYARFDLVNAVRIPLGVFTFAGPLLVLPFTTDLSAIVAVLLAGRLVACLAHGWLVRRQLSGLHRASRFAWSLVAPLLRFGGWMTVSNVVGPLMVYFDRFLVGALIGVSAVAYYATPYEVVTKLWLVPGALLSVLFPAFSAGMRRDPAAMAPLFGRALLVVLVLIAPITLLLVTFGEAGLALWVGAEFAQHSTVVLQWLAVGVLINCVAQVPFTLLQSAGRPDLPAKLHLCELPFYLLALVWLTLQYGIAGTAAAWVFRVALDAVLLFYLSLDLLPGSAYWVRRIAVGMAFILLLVPAGILLSTPALKLAFAATILVAGCGLGWVLWKRSAQLVRVPAVTGLREGQ